MAAVAHEPSRRIQAEAAPRTRSSAAGGSAPLLGAGTLAESDGLLLARCRQGSETAFAVLVRRHERELVRHCARLVGEASALDAAQDAFIAAWSEIRSGTEIRALRPWLFTVAHRKALAQLRERRRAPVEALPETLGGGFSAAEQALRAATVRDTLAALAALPQAQRDAFVAVAVQGRSGRQVARQLGISEITARQLVFRARAALRAAAAACLVPPALVLRWLRRLAAPPTRVAAAARTCAAGGWEGATATGRVLKFGALAIAGAGAVGAGALQLAPNARHAATAPESPGRVARGDRKRATVVLAAGGAARGGGDLRTRLGLARTWSTGRDSSPVFAPSDAGGGAQRLVWQARRPPGAPAGALDQSVDGTSAPSARVADAPSDGSATSGVVSASTGAVAGPSGVDPAAAVPGLARTAGALGHGGVSVLTETLAGAGGAVGSAVKQTVSTASGVVSTLTDSVAGASTLTGAVAPVVGDIGLSTGANPPVGATSGTGQLPGAVVQTVVSGGSQAVGSSAAGGVSTVTQTVAAVAQTTGAATNKVVQGATGAVSALSRLP